MESSLVEHDRYIRSLSKLKDQTDRQIIQKMVETRNSMTHNKYLKIVYNDYKTYFDRLVEEKHAQIKTLEAIYAHLNDITLENLKKHTSNDNIQKDKKEILREIRRIKHDLNIFMNIDAGKTYDIKKGGGGDTSSSSSDSDILVDTSDSETETTSSSSSSSSSSDSSSDNEVDTNSETEASSSSSSSSSSNSSESESEREDDDV